MSESEDQVIRTSMMQPKKKSSDTPVIIAMGVGGGGGNAVKYMQQLGVQGVDFVALNTDRQALDGCVAEKKILLGPELCEGRGAGGQPEIGRLAAEESAPEIDKFLDRKIDMVFITAGMGGGTGTGAAPVVARVAKQRGILTIGIVTIPFFFEGPDKMLSALDGAAELKKNVDALLIINNDRLCDIYPDMEWGAAFAKADDILATAARSISDSVTTPGMINIDMKDVDTTLRNGQTAFISVGYGEGENRMDKAIRNALDSPLLCDTNIYTAKKILFAFYYSHDIDPPFAVRESRSLNKMIQEMRGRINVIFGWGYDDSLGNQIKFTVLASGFDVNDEIKESPKEIEKEAREHDPSENKRLRQAYGDSKVDELERRKETQNYFILTPEQLDNDDFIALVEDTPAFQRDKRRQEWKNEEKRSNEIFFGDE